MTSIEDVPGISADDVAALTGLGLHSTDDLLRTERHALLRRVPTLTLSDVLRWQSIAELVQIEGVETADAADLVDGGVNGVEELSAWTPTRIRDACPRIDADTASAWAVDAMRISLTGVVNGYVRLRTGAPVENAVVRIGGQTLATDARGRFRGIRLALDRKLTIEVHHPDLGFKRVRNIPVHRSGALIATDVVLTGRRQTPTVLSELRGDTLPSLGSAPMSTRRVTEAPDPRDVLVVVSTTAGGDYETASRFLDFAEGRFVRRLHRIPRAEVAVIPQRGDDLVRDGAGWRVTKLNSGQLGRWAARLALARRFPDLPETQEQQDRMAQAIARSIGARR